MAWRAYLDRLLGSHGAKQVFSSFLAPSGYDFKDFAERFTLKATGEISINPDSVGFDTVTKQDCKATLADLPASDHLIVHLLAAFPSNVDRNFYMALEGGARETVRFSNTEVSLAETAAVHELNTREPRLYTLALGSEFTDLYVDGVLQKRKQRQSPAAPERLILELIGDTSADLGASVLGLEVWQSPKPFTGFAGGGDAGLIERLRAAIDTGDLDGVHDWIASFDGVDFSSLHEALFEVLDRGLGEGRGFKEWIYEDVLARLPEEVAGKWRAAWAGKTPVPQLEVRNLKVTFYRMPHERLSLARMIMRRELETFDVLNGINLSAYRGDIIGVIGANGAGKSTLLRAAAGLLPIDEGEIVLRGDHLLLSPGLGIRNELSGRENIQLACSFMGLNRKEIDAIYESIVEFSELTAFIDQPFKYYSDGMKSRLIFSIATAVAPDILMLDELLSAGDIAFQQKAARRMDEMIDRSKVVIVITHSMPFVVDKCNKALLISHGRPVCYGPPKTVVARFYNELHLPQPEVLTGDDGLSVNMAQQLTQQSAMPTISMS